MIYHEVERVKKVMKEKWLGDILEIYKVCVKKRQIPAQESRTYASFFKCLAVQMTLQIQQMTLGSMKVGLLFTILTIVFMYIQMLLIFMTLPYSDFIYH